MSKIQIQKAKWTKKKDNPSGEVTDIAISKFMFLQFLKLLSVYEPTLPTGTSKSTTILELFESLKVKEPTNAQSLLIKMIRSLGDDMKHVLMNQSKAYCRMVMRTLDIMRLMYEQVDVSISRLCSVLVNKTMADLWKMI